MDDRSIEHKLSEPVILSTGKLIALEFNPILFKDEHYRREIRQLLREGYIKWQQYAKNHREVQPKEVLEIIEELVKKQQEKLRKKLEENEVKSITSGKSKIKQIVEEIKEKTPEEQANEKERLALQVKYSMEFTEYERIINILFLNGYINAKYEDGKVIPFINTILENFLSIINIDKEGIEIVTRWVCHFSPISFD